MSFEDKTGDAATAADHAAAAEVVKPAVAPEVAPVVVEQVPKPQPPPYRQIDTERAHDKLGRPIGLNLRPKPGNAVTLIELRNVSQDGKWRVAVFTEPRRGRSSKKKDA